MVGERWCHHICHQCTLSSRWLTFKLGRILKSWSCITSMRKPSDSPWYVNTKMSSWKLKMIDFCHLLTWKSVHWFLPPPAVVRSKDAISLTVVLWKDSFWPKKGRVAWWGEDPICSIWKVDGGCLPLDLLEMMALEKNAPKLASNGIIYFPGFCSSHVDWESVCTTDLWFVMLSRPFDSMLGSPYFWAIPQNRRGSNARRQSFMHSCNILHKGTCFPCFVVYGVSFFGSS